MSTWHLNAQRKNQLVSSIFACSCINDNESRNTIVLELPLKLQKNIKYNSRPDIHVLNIINSCLDYPWGMEILIDTIRIIDRETIQLENLYTIIQNIRPQPITLKEIAYLKDILISVYIENHTLQKLYPQEKPLPENYEDRGLFFCILDTLAQFSYQINSNHPLIQYIFDISLHIQDDHIKYKISEWINKYSFKLGTKEEFIPKNYTTKTYNPDLYLLVDIIPHTKDHYRIQAWVWSGYRKSSIYAEDTYHHIHEIPLLIRRLLDLIVEDCIITDSNPIIEFFLPYHLLNHNIDQWILEENEPIGFQYCVTVRSHERAHTKYYWPRWIKKWELYRNISGIIPENLIENVIDLKDISSRNLRLKLERDVLCLSIACTLTEEIDVQKSILYMILRSGTPIVIWTRKSLDNPMKTLQEIKNVLSTSIFRNLPENIKILRQDSWANEDLQLGKHLILLWDDPQRLPHKLLYLDAPYLEKVNIDD